MHQYLFFSILCSVRNFDIFLAIELKAHKTVQDRWRQLRTCGIGGIGGQPNLWASWVNGVFSEKH